LIKSLDLSTNETLFVLARGGSDFQQTITCVDESVLKKLNSCAEHWTWENGKTVEAIRRSVEQNPQNTLWIACETAFFSHLPATAKNYALPAREREQGYLRFGADGLYHAWAARTHKTIHKLISVHLCENVSLAALLDGSPVDCSAGYSQLEGLPGLNTCGDLDPSIVGIFNEEGLSAEEIGSILYEQSGWQALSPKISFTELCNNVADDCRLPQAIFLHGLIKAIGAQLAILGGADLVLFGCEHPSDCEDLFVKLRAHFAFSKTRFQLCVADQQKILLDSFTNVAVKP
jgi:acetate kinase